MKEKDKSPKDLCSTNEATKLSILKVSSYRVKLAGWGKVHYQFPSFYLIPKEKTSKVSVGHLRGENVGESIHKKL